MLPKRLPRSGRSLTPTTSNGRHTPRLRSTTTAEEIEWILCSVSRLFYLTRIFNIFNSCHARSHISYARLSMEQVDHTSARFVFFEKIQTTRWGGTNRDEYFIYAKNITTLEATFSTVSVCRCRVATEYREPFQARRDLGSGWKKVRRPFWTADAWRGRSWKSSETPTRSSVRAWPATRSDLKHIEKISQNDESASRRRRGTCEPLCFCCLCLLVD